MYNKWFMAKVPQKIFGKNSKYKLKVRMQKVSAVQDWPREWLYAAMRPKHSGNFCHGDDGRQTPTDISRLLIDDKVKDVVGKPKRVFLIMSAG